MAHPRRLDDALYTHIKRLLCTDLTACANQFSVSDPVWQVRFYSFEIYTHGKLEEKLNSMHLNPVRAGLFERTIDWPWSSARWYEERRTVGIPIEWVD